MNVKKIKGKKLTATLLIAVFIISTLAIAIPTASADISYGSVGDGTAGLSDLEAHSGEYSAKLYVLDGGVDWAEVSIPVDMKIEDLDELSFWKNVVEGSGQPESSGWNPNVYLCIDADGEDGFTGDVAAYHHATVAGSSSAEAAAAHIAPDAFITLEFPTKLLAVDTEFVYVDAFTMMAWAVDANGQPGYNYGEGLAQFKTESFGLIDPTDKVMAISIVIGGCPNWIDETAYVDDVTINGEVYQFEIPGEPITETVTGDGTVLSSDADTSVDYTGAEDDTITIEDLSEDEVEEATFGAVGEYVDVQLAEGTGIDTLQIRVYYDDIYDGEDYEEQFIMYWYDGTEWLPCSDTGVEPGEDYIYANIGIDTSPSISQMTGTPFGPGGGMMLDKGFYHTDDTVTVTLGAAAENEDPEMKDIVGVYAYSKTQGYGVMIALKETGVDTGVFEGTFKLVDETPGTGEILVSTGDHFGAAYFEKPEDTEPTFSAGAIVDDTAPVVDITTPLDDATISGSIPIEATIDESYSYTALLMIDGEVIVGATAIDEYINYPWDTTLVDDGEITLEVVATDEAGNVGSDLISVNIDNTGPTVTGATASPSIIGLDTSTDVVLTATVVDAGAGVDTVMVDCSDIGGDSAVPLSAPVDSDVYTATVEGITATVEDTFELTITATDLLGNVNDLDFIAIEVIEDLVGPYEVGFTEAVPISGGLIVRGLYMEDLLTGPGSYDILVNGIALETPGERLLETELISETWTSTDDYGWFKRSIVLDLTGTVDPVTVTLIAYDLVGTAADPITLYEGLIPEGEWCPVELYDGWNLVSLPLIPDSSDSGDVLSLILDQGASGVVISYDYDQYTDTWITNPTEMTDGYGYWLYMLDGDVMIVEGIERLPAPALPQTYEFTAGWVLAGYKQTADKFIDDYLASLQTGSYFGTVYTWDATAVTPAWDTLSTAATPKDKLSPGMGFWIWMYSDQNLIAPLE